MEIWRLTSLFNSEKVRDKAFELVLSKFQTVAERKDFMELSSDELIEIVKDDRLEVSSEEYVVKVALQWGQHNEEHKNVIGYVFSNLRLCQLSFEHLYELKTFFTTTIDSQVARQSMDVAIELNNVSTRRKEAAQVYRAIEIVAQSRRFWL